MKPSLIELKVFLILLSAGYEHFMPAAPPQPVEAGEVRVRGVPAPASCSQVQTKRSRPGER